MQEKANELYPGLFKPIILRNSRYNQHLAKAACIIEVGATGNVTGPHLHFEIRKQERYVNPDLVMQF